jgi:hypothetical protein
MNINFNWKYSSQLLPNINDKIIAARDGIKVVDNQRAKEELLIIGKFVGVWEYGKGRFVYGVVGRELRLNTTITFGDCSLIWDLPLDGFFWDYVKPTWKYPGIKELRRLKLESLK